MKTILTWLGWLLVIIVFKIAGMAGIHWSHTAAVVFGAMFLLWLMAQIIKKIRGTRSAENRSEPGA